MECNQTQIPGLSLPRPWGLPHPTWRWEEWEGVSAILAVVFPQLLPSVDPGSQSCVLWLPLLVVTAGFILLSISILSSFHTMGSVPRKLHFALAYTLARPASLALFTF